MLEGRASYSFLLRKPERVLGAGPVPGRVKEIRFVFHLLSRPFLATALRSPPTTPPGGREGRDWELHLYMTPLGGQCKLHERNSVRTPTSALTQPAVVRRGDLSLPCFCHCFQ